MAAWTNEGVGAAKTATIQSGIEPVLPGPPSRLAVSNIEAFSVVLQFTPGFDGNSSITKWTVQVTSVFQSISFWNERVNFMSLPPTQAQSSPNSTWDTICQVSDPEAN